MRYALFRLRSRRPSSAAKPAEIENQVAGSGAPIPPIGGSSDGKWIGLIGWVATGVGVNAFVTDGMIDVFTPAHTKEDADPVW